MKAADPSSAPATTGPRAQPGVVRRLALLSAGARLGVALTLSALAAVLLPAAIPWPIRAVAAWDAFALPALALIWLTILTLSPAHIRQVAQREDPGRVAAMVLVVIGAGVALLAVVVLLAAHRRMDAAEEHAALALALPAVAMAWGLTHTVFTLRYAHVFYGEAHGRPGDSPGLLFPDKNPEPDYLDFAYFAFTLGMAAQTADVAVVSRSLRRLTLLHALISFLFNTAVITLSVSAVAAFL